MRREARTRELATLVRVYYSVDTPLGGDEARSPHTRKHEANTRTRDAIKADADRETRIYRHADIDTETQTQRNTATDTDTETQAQRHAYTDTNTQRHTDHRRTQPGCQTHRGAEASPRVGGRLGDYWVGGRGFSSSHCEIDFKFSVASFVPVFSLSGRSDARRRGRRRPFRVSTCT